MKSRLVRRLASLALWSGGVSVVGLMAGLEAARLVSPIDRPTEAAIQVIVGGAVSASAWLLTFRWHETNRVLRRRGVRLPVIVGGRSV